MPSRVLLATVAASLLLSVITIGLLLFVLGQVRALDGTIARSETSMTAVSDQLRGLSERMGENAGAIEYQSVALRFLANDASPLAGIDVELSPTDETKAAGGVQSTETTDADGRVVFPLVRSGAYVLGTGDESAQTRRAIGLADGQFPNTTADIASRRLFTVPLGHPVRATYRLPSYQLAGRVRFDVASVPPPPIAQMLLVSGSSRKLPPATVPLDRRFPMTTQTGWYIQVKGGSGSTLRLPVTRSGSAEADCALGVSLSGPDEFFVSETGQFYELERRQWMSFRKREEQTDRYSIRVCDCGTELREEFLASRSLRISKVVPAARVRKDELSIFRDGGIDSLNSEFYVLTANEDDQRIRRTMRFGDQRVDLPRGSTATIRLDWKNWGEVAASR